MFFNRLFFWKKQRETKKRVDYFALHENLHLQLEFFLVFPDGKSDLQSWMTRTLLNASTRMTRIKMCIRIRLIPTATSRAILETIFNIDRVLKEEKEILNKLHAKRSDTLSNSFSKLTVIKGKLYKRLRALVDVYVAKSDICDVAMEDTQYEYHLIADRMVFIQTKSLIAKNKNPMWCFLCSSPSLLDSEQKVIVGVL